MPAFKIYDYSSNSYFIAQPSESIPWVYLEYPIIDELNSFGDIYGCMNPQATNYDSSANNDDNSCIFQDFICDEDIEDWVINPPDFEFSGSVSVAVYLDGEMVNDENDLLAGFVGDEIRGMVSPLVFPPTNAYIFSLLLYSNHTLIEFVFVSLYFLAK